MARRSDGEDEVALVDVANAAATSLFSPNMWVRRPSRTPRRDALHAAQMNAQSAEAADAPQAGEEHPVSPSAQHQQPGPRAKRPRGEDQDLSYLEANDREGAEKHQIEEDLAHIAAIETEILRTQETTRDLQLELHDITASINTIRAQNDSVKRMFGALNVCVDDFNMAGAADEASRKRRMIEIGQRLIKSMTEPREEPKTEAAAPPVRTQPRRGRPPLNPQPTQTPATVAGAARPVFTPPASFPVESQIAAASLTLSQGDPAVALLSLLEKALAARAPPVAAGQMSQQPAAAPVEEAC